MSETCVAVEGGLPCTAEAAGRIAMGCVHEHTAEAPICDQHRDRALAEAAAGNFTCDPCEAAGCMHCPLTVMVVAQ